MRRRWEGRDWRREREGTGMAGEKEGRERDRAERRGEEGKKGRYCRKGEREG